MGGLSLWHWLVLIFIFFVVGYPIAKILGRLGLSKLLVVLAFIPIINWVALWVLAFAKWPAVQEKSEIFE